MSGLAWRLPCKGPAMVHGADTSLFSQRLGYGDQELPCKRDLTPGWPGFGGRWALWQGCGSGPWTSGEQGQETAGSD